MGLLSSKKSTNTSSSVTTVTTNNIVTDSGAIEAMRGTASEALALSGTLTQAAFQYPVEVLQALSDRDEKIVLGLAESVQSNIKDFAQKVVAPANDIADQLRKFGTVAVIAFAVAYAVPRLK